MKTGGSGGAEEAVLWLSQLLCQRGWNVEIYSGCVAEEKQYGEVVWKPLAAWNVGDPRDVVFLWRFPTQLKFQVNARAVYLELQETIPPDGLTPERLARVTRIFIKSKFHRSAYPHIPEDKFVIVPNGIDARLFAAAVPRDPMLIINTALPTRSLSALLDCYERIKNRVPQARLQWAYGWNVFDIQFGWDPAMREWKSRMRSKMAELGVEDLGRLSYADVAQLYLKANIFAYPSEAAEVDCISISKAMAAGAIPLTTDFAAMGEKSGHGGVFIPSNKTIDLWTRLRQSDFSIQDEKQKSQFVEEAVRLLQNPPPEEARRSMRLWSQATFDWDQIADQWPRQIDEDLLLA